MPGSAGTGPCTVLFCIGAALLYRERVRVLSEIREPAQPPGQDAREPDRYLGVPLQHKQKVMPMDREELGRLDRLDCC